MSEVKFIRVRGKVVPIRDKKKGGGADKERKPNKKETGQAISNTFKKHGRDQTKGERFKMGMVIGGTGALIGAQIGAVAQMVASKGSRFGKGAAIGAATLGGLMGYAGSRNSKVMSDKKFNKEFPKELKALQGLKKKRN